MLRSLTVKPNGSNSTETELSIVNLQTEMRFFYHIVRNENIFLKGNDYWKREKKD